MLVSDIVHVLRSTNGCEKELPGPAKGFKMNCDCCKKILTEDDTHEHILCTRCMDERSKVQCARCRCVISSNKFLKGFLKLLKGFFASCKKLSPIYLFLGMVMLVSALMAPIKYKVAAALASGVAVVSIAIFIALVVGWLLFPIPYRVGWKINKKYKWDIESIDEGPGGIVVWFIGLSTISSPVIFYLICKLFILVGNIIIK